MTDNGNEPEEMTFAVQTGWSVEGMIPFVSVVMNGERILTLGPVVAWRVGMEMMTKSRQIIDESLILEIFANREIPGDTAFSIIEALRNARSGVGG